MATGPTVIIYFQAVGNSVEGTSAVCSPPDGILHVAESVSIKTDKRRDQTPRGIPQRRVEVKLKNHPPQPEALFDKYISISLNR